MLEAIQEVGLIPFSPKKVKGWSIQEMTSPAHWFTTSDDLGPWDWRIEAVQSGMVLSKCIGNTTAFATPLMFRHLMNWRRSLPRYRMALGESYPARTLDDKLQSLLSPTLLELIRSRGVVESTAIRKLLEEHVPLQTRQQVGGHVEKYLIPGIKRTAVDYLMQFLDMGTWTVIADIQRVYKGPGMEYKGWQKTLVCLADDFLSSASSSHPETAELPQASSQPRAPQPFWAKFIEPDPEEFLPQDIEINCSPEESREFIISHLLTFFPGQRSAFEKLI